MTPPSQSLSTTFLHKQSKREMTLQHHPQTSCVEEWGVLEVTDVMQWPKILLLCIVGMRSFKVSSTKRFWGSIETLASADERVVSLGESKLIVDALRIKRDVVSMNMFSSGWWEELRRLRS
jgi:hypothetical protein